ncbi:MAG: N-methylhydantoinase [Thermomicrobiales bacterium]|jgi:N-methylhydantoinase B|nr:N-methylhydantoinase [Thermomicrobiales bacterium]
MVLSRSPVDDVTLEVLWNKLVSICDEAAAALYRASVSVIVGEVFDFSVAITNTDGDAIAFPTKSMPLFNGSVSLTTREILRRFPLESMREDDTFICNDPWIASGHLSDVFLASPIFSRGQVVGLAVSIAHVTDIGGSLKRIGTTEVYEEGLRIPPCRLINGGQDNADVIDFIRYNVRVPDMVLNDFYAQIGAHKVIERRIRELLEEAEAEDLQSLSDAILERSEAAMRSAIRALPTGTYEAEALTDGFLDPLLIKVGVSTTEDGDLFVDYTGSSPESRQGAINSPYACTYSETVSTIHTVLLPQVPANAGCFRPIRVIAPEGSVFNARPPAAVNIRTRAVFLADPVVMAALAHVVPDKVMAAPGQAGGYQLHGSYEGKPFLTFFMQSGGMGATAKGAGASCVFFPGTMSTGSLEVIEQHGPVLIRGKRILRDSGGDGRFRGGCGQEVVVTLRPEYEGAVTVSMHPHMLEFPASGLFGGKPGEVGKILLNGERIDKYRLHTLGGAVVLHPGGELIIKTPGGGGFAPPEKEHDRKEKSAVKRAKPA